MTRSKTLHCVFERDKGMREVDVNEIIKNIKEMCIEANHFLSKDMKEVYDAAADFRTASGKSANCRRRHDSDLSGYRYGGCFC